MDIIKQSIIISSVGYGIYILIVTMLKWKCNKKKKFVEVPIEKHKLLYISCYLLLHTIYRY